MTALAHAVPDFLHMGHGVDELLDLFFHRIIDAALLIHHPIFQFAL